MDGLSIKSMLDIGTGSGVFAEEFFKRSLSVAGIDLNPGMVEIAKGYVPEGEFKIAKAEEIPFKDKSFDLVFMGLVFHEVDDPVCFQAFEAFLCAEFIRQSVKRFFIHNKLNPPWQNNFLDICYLLQN
jgi:SAM-dependent methyltransferase